MSVSYSTRPLALRGALSRLTMPRLRGSAGSSSPFAVPMSFSYAPAEPKAAPAANGPGRWIATETMRASADSVVRAVKAATASSVFFMELLPARSKQVTATLESPRGRSARPALLPDLGIDREARPLAVEDGEDLLCRR